VTEMANSAQLRPVLAVVAGKMFVDRPLFGVGYGQYKKYDVYYLDDRSTTYNLDMVRPYHQHNILLSILVETGLVGMVLYASMLGVWAHVGWRLWKSRSPLAVRQFGLVGVTTVQAYFINGMFQDMTIMPMLNMSLYFMGGTAMALLIESSRLPVTRPQAWVGGGAFSGVFGG
ncbi:MAG: O-antigen ligase family protein, partial [Planctomycetales bacterium]|nr:O-antigen ligase family protein [Planctomycetales bacterium]